MSIEASIYFVVCALVFFATFAITIVTTSIGFHRGLAHGAVTIRPPFRWLLLATGNWLTGIDPKAWVVMHRLHHQESDKPGDPHSPSNVGMMGILAEQLRGYNRTLAALWNKEEKYERLGEDLDFPLSWPIRTKLWFMPYVNHIVVAVVLTYLVGWLLGVAYFAGIMSHAVQGGLVNSFGHAVGGRNFNLDDNSRNNNVVSWLVLGEGYQNNHHKNPGSARFSYAPGEVDFGYAVCIVLQALGVLHINRDRIVPLVEPAVEGVVSAAVDGVVPAVV